MAEWHGGAGATEGGSVMHVLARMAPTLALVAALWSASS